MRKLTAIRLLLFAVAVAGMLSPARAQYSGGAAGADGYAVAGVRHLPLDSAAHFSPAYTATDSGGDGYSSSGSAFIALNGISLPGQLYTATGSGGDGYSVAGRAHVPLNGSALPSQLYTATTSGGDGYSSSGLFNRVLNGATAVLASYKGGGGDGYDGSGFENTFISPEAAVLVIYSSGPSGGDGYDFDGFRHSGMGAVAAAPEIYSASESGGDGYDAEGLHYQALDGATTPEELYAGSASGGDGYDRDGVAFVSVNGEAAFAFAYLNSGGDGYSLNGLHHGALSPPPALPAALYAGDEGDGYDTRSLPFVQYLGGGDAASPITFSGWLNSRFSEEEISAGLAAPAADADQDGLANLLEYSIGSDPRVADASTLGPHFRLSNLSDLGYPALSDHYLTALVRRNPLALDATMRVEVASDLSTFWSANETILVDSTPSAFLVRDQYGVKTEPHRSMRLRATLNP